MDLSIVIPAFNEESRLPAAIDGLRRFLDEHQFDAEVLIVENGSTDRTASIAAAAANEDPRFHVMRIPAPGKGRAVRTGMMATSAPRAVFCDADFSMPVDEMVTLLDALDDTVDVAIASREAPGARRIGEPFERHLMGRVFNFLVRTMAVPGLADTQCGFKAFRREVVEDLFPRLKVDGWAFDVEVLFLAQREGYAVREIPVTWQYDASSRVRPLRDTIAMLRELLYIRYNDFRGRYGAAVAVRQTP